MVQMVLIVKKSYNLITLFAYEEEIIKVLNWGCDVYTQTRRKAQVFFYEFKLDQNEAEQEKINPKAIVAYTLK